MARLARPRRRGAPLIATPVPSALVDPARRWAEQRPAGLALRDAADGRTWTWREVDAAVTRWAAYLARAGVEAGDRVALLARNRPELLVLWLAALRRRAALVPLNWRLAPRELERVLAHASPRLLVGDAVSCAGLTMPWVSLDALPAATPAAGDDVHGGAWHPDDDAMVLYTSGSTGQPKGARLSVRQIIANADATARGWALTADDVAAITSPLFHTGAWHAFASPVWWCGGTVVVSPAFEPATWLATLAASASTLAFVVPTQLAMVAEHPDFGRPLPALRRMIVGGASCTESLRRRCREAGYPVFEGFGMTEFGPNCFTGAPMTATPGSVGVPMPEVEARLVDGDGRDVSPDVPGELWLRGPACFSGYLHDAARTRVAIADDGWYRTGDMLQRDAAGGYRVAGRRHERFISGGEHVYPGEIEAVAASHPGVAEVVVVPTPDPIWGEVGCAFVVPHPGEHFEVAALRAHLRAHLAGYKVPRRITVLTTMPRLATGKPDRAGLAAYAAHGTTDSMRPSLHP